MVFRYELDMDCCDLPVGQFISLWKISSKVRCFHLKKSQNLETAFKYQRIHFTLVSLEFFSSSLADGPPIISSIFPATPGHWGQNKATGTTQPWTPKPERKQIVETENQWWKHHIIHSCFGNTLIPSNSTDFMGISTSYILTCLYLSFSSPCLLCGATWRRRLRRHLGKNMFASLASHHCLVSETNGRKIANCLAWISGSFLKILGYSIYV